MGTGVRTRNEKTKQKTSTIIDTEGTDRLKISTGFYIEPQLKEIPPKDNGNFREGTYRNYLITPMVPVLKLMV